EGDWLRRGVTDRRPPYHRGWAGRQVLKGLEQPPEELGPIEPALNQQVFGVGVRAAPVRAKPIEGGDTNGGGEITVAAAPGAGLAQCKANLTREALRQLGQADGAGAPLHRRPVDAAADA